MEWDVAENRSTHQLAGTESGISRSPTSPVQVRGKTTVFMLDNGDDGFLLKTVFLLALASGKRRSEIHALSQGVRWINGDVRTVEIAPVTSFMSKTHVITSGLGALRPITLSSLEEGGDREWNGDYLLCPVRTLRSSRRSTGHQIKRDSLFLTGGVLLGIFRDKQSPRTSRRLWS